jgi:TRAP-type C4-dicarboxylate transport system permease small subunit
MAEEGRFVRVVRDCIRRLCWIAGFTTAIMMAFIFFEVIARFSGNPTRGSNDVVQILLLIVAVFAMGYTQVMKRHPFIPIIIDRFPGRAKKIIASITTMLGIVIFTVLTWQSFMLSERMRVTSSETASLFIPVYPLIYCVALGGIIISAALIVDLVAILRTRSE